MERNRLSYFIVGFSIMAIWAVVNPNVPALALLPTDHLGMLANAFLISWAIGKYDLLDIRH